MTKNNHHEIDTKAVSEICQDIVLHDGHTLTAAESLHFDLGVFVPQYENFFDRANMPPLALQVTQDEYNQKTITIHPECLRRLGDGGLKEYRGVFIESYEDANGQGVGDFVLKSNPQGEEKPPEGPQKIQYRPEFPEARQKNADFAAGSVYMLFEEYDAGFPDDYGMIENRKTLFFELMDDVCDTYALPRLHIKFNEKDEPFFDAAPEHVDKVKELYHERKATLTKLTDELTHGTRTDVEREIALSLGIGALRSTWKNMENPTYAFPEQHMRYSNRYLLNSADLTTLDGGHSMVMADEDMVVKPGKLSAFPAPMLN